MAIHRASDVPTWRKRAVGRFLWFAIAALGLLVAPSLASPYVLTLLVLSGIYGLGAIGLNLFMGYTGQVSFGHNAFAAIGGYVSAIATTSYGWPPLLSLIVGVIISVTTAWLVGYPTLRLRGHFLAVATFALGQIVYLLSVQMEPITNGYVGIAGIPPLAIAGWQLGSVRAYFYVVWGLLAISLLSIHRIERSRLGRALVAINQNETAARSIGVDAIYFKCLAFAISAAYVSISGSILAHFLSFVSPELFGLSLVVMLFTALFLGGIGTVYGPLLGTVVVIALPEISRGAKDYALLIYSILVVVILVAAPQGIFSFVRAIPAVSRRHRGRRGAEERTQ